MENETLHANLVDLAETLLDENHPLNLNMQVFSMFFILKEGDTAIVEKWNPQALSPGDIIVFKTHNKLVTHRLMKIEYRNGIRYFLAKGYKNIHFD